MSVGKFTCIKRRRGRIDTFVSFDVTARMHFNTCAFEDSDKSHSVLLFQPRCHQYWPSSVDEPVKYGDIFVTLDAAIHCGDYIVRVMTVQQDVSVNSSNNSRSVAVLRVRAW